MPNIQTNNPVRPKVSILVPCYNVEQYVEECLNSLLRQTLSELEIICINDGSTDNTGSILQHFQSSDQRIKIIDKKNTGYGDSMNIGLDNCHGEYVGIVEPDDFIDDSMYHDLYTRAKQFRLDQVRAGYFLYMNGKDISEHLLPDIPKEKVFSPKENTRIFLHAPAIWASIYNLDWLNRNHIRFLPTPGASYQDRSFSFKTLYCADRFMMVNKAYLHYRQHANNSVKSSNKIYCISQEWEEIFNFIFGTPPYSTDVQNILIPLSLKTFRSNYKRLNPKYRNEFLKSCAHFYSQFDIVDSLARSLSPLDKLEYQIITKYPSLYGVFLPLKRLLLRHIF